MATWWPSPVACTVGWSSPPHHEPNRSPTWSPTRWPSTRHPIGLRRQNIRATSPRTRTAAVLAENRVQRHDRIGDDLVVPIPTRQIRARYTADTIRVYQAYSPEIALPAVAAGRLVAPFRRDRMTWIKPSFLWMMYRCGWASKPGQEHVLAIDITREGFEWALTHACLSHYDRHRDDDRPTWARRLKTSPGRVQWDPERSLRLGPLPYRSVQVGLSAEAVAAYVDTWTVAVTDVTATAHQIHDLLRAGDERGAAAQLPPEHPYPLPPEIGATIGASTA
jgi:Domain of unknown function (DUF4291)